MDVTSEIKIRCSYTAVMYFPVSEQIVCKAKLEIKLVAIIIRFAETLSECYIFLTCV